MYAPDLDLEALVGSMGSGRANVSSTTAVFARDLLRKGLQPPRQDGCDMGDHDPVMPVLGGGWRMVNGVMRPASRSYPLTSEAADLYDLIVRVFLASLAPDATIEQTSILLEPPFGGCTLRATGVRVRELGWIEILPVACLEDTPLPPDLVQAAMDGQRLQVREVFVVRIAAGRPPRLREAGLLALMERHGIGTDASMPTHIANIIDRRYAKVKVHTSANLAGKEKISTSAASRFIPSSWYRTVREMYPTNQGSLLFRWYILVCDELAAPSVRADVEAACLRISRGEAPADETLQHFVEDFWWKFSSVFESRRSAKQCRFLVDLLKMTHEQRCGDARWKHAEQWILQMKLDQMAEQRRRALEDERAVSEPALPMITHCLLRDAVVLMADGTPKLARALGVGEQLQAAFCHRGNVLRGVCAVHSVTSFLPRQRDVTTVTSSGRGCVAKVTSNHSFLAKRAEGDLQRGPVIARGLSTSLEVMVLEADPCSHEQELARPARIEQAYSAHESVLWRFG